MIFSVDSVGGIPCDTNIGFSSKALDTPTVQDGALISLLPNDVIDKTFWGKGPWQYEPDYLAYVCDGYDCLIMRTAVGCLTGYIAIPADHPWYDLEPDEVPVRVHGGLEWKQVGNDHWRRTSREDVVWFGFSCSHIGDYFPVDGMIYEKEAIPVDDSSPFFTKRSYKTIEYVKSHIEVFCHDAQAAQTAKT
jgi:hypothetical protein